MRTLRRIAVVSLSLLAVILFLIVAILFVVSSTDWGRERVRSIAVSQLQSSINGNFEIDRLEGDLLSHVRLLGVTVVDSAGRPFLRADTISTEYSLRALLSKKIQLDNLRLVNTEIVLDQPPGEEWNFVRIFTSENGDTTTSAWGDWVAIHDISVVESRVTTRSAWEPPPGLSPAEERQAINEALSEDSRVNVVEESGAYLNVMDFRGLDAAISRILVAHPDTSGIPIDVDRFSGVLQPFEPPPADIRDLSGHFRLQGDTIHFADVSALLPDSRVTGDGYYAMEVSKLVLSVEGSPVAFADLQWLYPPLPEEGIGSLDLDYVMDSTAHDVSARDVDIRVGESELRGDVAARFGETVEVRDSDLRFSSLSTHLIERLAPAASFPRHGRLNGRLAVAGSQEDLQLDGDIAFEDDTGGTSRVVVDGGIAATDGIRFDNLEVVLQPLQADLVRAFFPDVPVGGIIHGRTTVTGGPGDRMQIESGLVMDDPQTGTSRIDAEGGLVFGETVQLEDLRIYLDPLQLDLVRPYASDVPQGATATGPIRLDGSVGGMLRIDGDMTLEDPSTGISRVAAAGSVDMEDDLQFEQFDLRFAPFRMELVRLVDPEFPLGGTLEGNATVSGSPSERLQVTANLVHADEGERSHITGGGIVGTGPDALVDLDVQVDPLSLRTVGLFAPGAGLRGTAEGDIAVAGTMRDLGVDVDLQFDDGGSIELAGRLGLTGSDTTYAVTASLNEFDPSAVTDRSPLATTLSGTTRAEGSGFDPATMQAFLHADLEGVELDEYAADEVFLRIDVADGLATVEPARIRLSSAEAEIEGTFGLVPDRDGALAYRVEVDSLNALAPLVPAPADTGVVRPRPAVRQQALLEAERAERDAEVQFLATGRLPETSQVEEDAAVTLIRRDSLSGSLEASGTLQGNLDRFDAAGAAAIDQLVYQGHYIESGEVDFSATGVGEEDVDAALDASFTSMLLGGFAFDSAGVNVVYEGGRYGSGEIEAAIVQNDLTDLRVDADFALTLERNEIALQDMALRMDTVTWTATSPAQFDWGGEGLAVEDLELRSNFGGRLYLDGSLPMEGPANMEIAVSDFEIGHILDLLQDDREASGLLTLNAVVQGTSGSPQIDGRTSLTEASFEEDALPDVNAVFEYVDEELEASAELVQNGTSIAVLEARIPMTLALGDGGPGLLDRPLQVDVRADRLPLDVAPIFTDQIEAVDGTIDAELSVTGTPSEPVIEGDVSLEVQTLYLVPLGIRFEPISGHASMSGGVLQIDSLVAWSDGPVSISGNVDFESLSSPELDLQVEARETWVIDTENANLQVDADLAVVGPMDALEVSGPIRTRRGVIYVPELSEFGSTNIVDLDDPAHVEQLDTVLAMQREFVSEQSEIAENLELEVEITIDRNVWLRSNEANVEIYTPPDIGPLSVRMAGLQEMPQLEGTINTDRGEYEYMSRRFRLTRGAVTFLESEEIDPLLQLAAEHDVPMPGRESLTIRIVVGGTLRDLQVTLESDAQPPISETDLISFLAFGREASSLIQGQGSSIGGQASGGSGLVGNVAGVATQQFTAIALDAMISDLEAEIGRDLGLDVIRITPASVSADIFTGGYLDVLRGTEVEAGVYLGPRLFVAAQARPTLAYPGVSVEYRTRRDFEWTASWGPRFVPIVPTLREPEAEQIGVLGSFLFREWRF